MKDLLDASLADVEKHEDFIFLAVPGAETETPAVLQALVALFMDIHQASGGVWPVLRANKSALRDRVCDWVKYRYAGADIAAFVIYAPDNTPSELIGAGCLKSLARESDTQRDYWNGGLIDAIRSRKKERASQLAFLHRTGLPLEAHEHEMQKQRLSEERWVINPDKTATLHSGGISPRWRRKGLGQRLLHFRKKVSHQYLQKAVLFNVIADEAATKPAIALYQKEKALFLGNHCDGKKQPRYEMELYAFPFQT